jgi:hypothetical protein
VTVDLYVEVKIETVVVVLVETTLPEVIVCSRGHVVVYSVVTSVTVVEYICAELETGPATLLEMALLLAPDDGA